MFIENYIDETKFKLLYDTYEEWYLNSLDEKNFIKIYNLFKKYNFYYIDDIVLNYLEVFTLDVNEIEVAILNLKVELGEYFVYIIGNDMRHLERLLD